ncbi:molybdopterin dinucleotide binding domain-containing protein, partial [Bradyrhizobium lablabi]
NPASNTVQVEKALRALDLVVVVDVAMTETAQLAHYVLPASSQYEKTEFTLFNFEFPRNYFHVRAGVVAPLAGTLPEPEIYTRLSRALGLLPGDNALAPLRDAALRSRPAFAAELRAFMGANPQLAALGALVLYNTLGATLPDGTAAAAPLWQAAHLCAKRSPQAVRRALNAGRDVPDEMLGEALFDAIVGSRNGAAFTEHDYDEAWSLVSHSDRKVRLAIAPLREWLGKLDPANAAPRGDYPFVLAAGQRRMFNANQIFRDPAWRRDDPDGALLISAADLASLGAEDGEWIAVQSAAGRVVARCKRDDSMRSGQLALPHGYGQDYPAADGERLNNGPRVNVLTESGNRDPIAGTPYHKHVPVRLERLAAAEAAAYEAASRRIHPAPA